MGGKGRQGTENENENQAVANPQLQVQPLTFTGTVAIHEDDAQYHQEETQLGCVFGPKGVQKIVFSAAICMRYSRQLIHLASLVFLGIILPQF